MLVAARDFDWYSRWDSAGKTWHEKWSNVLNSIDELPLPDRIEMLGKAAESSVGGNMGGERSDIFNRAQSTLLAIPGHARFYQDKIERIRSQALVDNKKGDDEIMRMRMDHTMVEFDDYESFREKAFVVLSLLPSSETVAVLGHFLNDPEGLDGRDLTGERLSISDSMPFPANARASVIALCRLGIENSPFQAVGSRDFYGEVVNKEELGAWRGWWNDVKDGRRTYRFIGSGVEYGPEGPVSAKKGHQSKTDRQGNSVLSPQEDHSRTAMIIVGVLAACSLCVAAVWYFLRSARMKARKD